MLIGETRSGVEFSGGDGKEAERFLDQGIKHGQGLGPVLRR
jgi:hypothetical protein